MSDFYSQLTPGTDPLDLAETKLYLKVDNTADDTLIQLMIDSAIGYAQDFTGRQYRTGATWRLLIDDFEDRICIRKSDVTTVTAVEHLVSDVWTAVATSVYYLKESPLWHEVLLKNAQVWPTNSDTIEHRVRIDFTTGPHALSADQVKLGMLRHISALYDDRGDCEQMSVATGGGMLPIAALNDSARRSGAQQLYQTWRIPRF